MTPPWMLPDQGGSLSPAPTVTTGVAAAVITFRAYHGSMTGRPTHPSPSPDTGDDGEGDDARAGEGRENVTGPRRTGVRLRDLRGTRRPAQRCCRMPSVRDRPETYQDTGQDTDTEQDRTRTRNRTGHRHGTGQDTDTEQGRTRTRNRILTRTGYEYRAGYGHMIGYGHGQDTDTEWNTNVAGVLPFRGWPTGTGASVCVCAPGLVSAAALSSLSYSVLAGPAPRSPVQTVFVLTGRSINGNT